MIVDTKIASPQVSSQGVVTKNGAASMHFSAPQVYLFSGNNDGDGNVDPNTGKIKPIGKAGDQFAALFDGTFGAQTVTFAWTESADLAAYLPTTSPVFVAGLSYGGAGAVEATHHVNNGATIDYLYLFDPVAPVGQPFASSTNVNFGQTNGYSTFTLGGNVAAAFDWRASAAVQADYSGYAFPTGDITTDPNPTFTNFLESKPANYNGFNPSPFSLGLVHASQVVLPSSLKIVKGQLKNSITEWQF
jgi:hypothetical protein